MVAFHALSAMAQVLLRELRVPSTLNAGWVLLPSGNAYAHSWVEVDGQVYDIACERPNRHRSEFRRSAVLVGLEVSSGLAAAEVYGASSDKDFDAETIRIGTGTISSWLVPSGSYDWFWRPTELLGQRVAAQNPPRFTVAFAQTTCGTVQPDRPAIVVEDAFRQDQRTSFAPLA